MVWVYYIIIYVTLNVLTVAWFHTGLLVHAIHVIQPLSQFILHLTSSFAAVIIGTTTRGLHLTKVPK